MPVNLQKAEFVLSAVSPKNFIQDGRPQVAFAGRSNVGKSSVINRLLNRKNFARVGAAPGKTVHVNYFNIDGAFYLVDLPGYGYAKVSQREKQRWAGLMEGYFAQDRDIALVLSLVDSRHPPSREDLQMLDFLIDQELPFLVVLTKVDKLSPRERRERLAAFRQELPMGEELAILPFSAQTGEGREELRAILDQLENDLLGEEEGE